MRERKTHEILGTVGTAGEPLFADSEEHLCVNWKFLEELRDLMPVEWVEPE